jgi:hypothetical protein
MSKAGFLSALIPAAVKLIKILEREGDADGERVKPEYLMQLILEEMVANHFTQETMVKYKEKRNTAFADAPPCELIIS